MKLSFEEKENFAKSMALIINAGFDIYQGIDMIEQSEDNPRLKTVLKEVLENLQEDTTLSQAISKTQAFDDYMVHLLEAGEISGHLDGVMSSLSDYYQRMKDMSSSLKQAITYPIVLLLMMQVVVGVIVFKVLPIFQGVLKSLGGELSTYAYTFMKCGQIFSFMGFLVLTIVFISLISIFIYAKIKHVDLLSVFIYRMPFMKKLSYALSHAQMTYAFSMFISSGYEFEDAIQYTLPLIEEKQLKGNLKKCLVDLQADMPFEETLANNQIYHGMKLNILQVGIKTGQVDQIFQQLSMTYQDEVNESIAHFLNVIEPTMVTFLSVIVGIVLLSVMLPIVSILSSL